MEKLDYLKKKHTNFQKLKKCQNGLKYTEKNN